MSENVAIFLPSTRVILWVHPRSRSTVLELAIASDKSIHVVHEPFAMAYYEGEERLCHVESITTPPLPGYRYRDMQAMLENDHPGKVAIFVKDSAKCLGGRDRFKYMPRGYINTFMVRNPKATVLSSFRCVQTKHRQRGVDPDTLVEFCEDLCDMAPIFELYKYVTEELQQPAIVIDSQDLANSPEDTLQKYCKLTGLPFRETFLNWEAGNIDHFPDFMKSSEFAKLFYDRALKSSCFQPSSDSDVNLSELPEKLRHCIDEYTPLYEEMIIKKL